MVSINLDKNLRVVDLLETSNGQVIQLVNRGKVVGTLLPPPRGGRKSRPALRKSSKARIEAEDRMWAEVAGKLAGQALGIFEAKHRKRS